MNMIFSTFIILSFSLPKPATTKCFSRVPTDAICGFAKSTRLDCTRKMTLTTKMNSLSCGSENGQDTRSGTSKITFLLSQGQENQHISCYHTTPPVTYGGKMIIIYLGISAPALRERENSIYSWNAKYNLRDPISGPWGLALGTMSGPKVPFRTLNNGRSDRYCSMQ